MATFRSVRIGEWFNFIGPDWQMNTFYSRCQKISARKYRWTNPACCSLPRKYKWLETRVVSINAEVYNVGTNEVSPAEARHIAEQEREAAIDKTFPPEYPDFVC